MRRWQYAAACAVAAAIMVAGSSGPAHAADNCTVYLMYEPSGRLYHGTPHLVFEGKGLFPWGPAWFGRNPEFSVHAAVRHVESREKQIRVLAYRHKRPLKLVQCENAAEVEKFAVHQRWLRDSSAQRHDGEVAKAICDANLPNSSLRMRVGEKRITLDGYRLLKDAVRKEVEYIICRPSEVLNYASDGSTLQIVWTGEYYGGPLWTTRGKVGDFRLYYRLGLNCFVRLPEADRSTACPGRGTMPRLSCCDRPKPPPRSH